MPGTAAVATPQAVAALPAWSTVNPDGTVDIHLYFFWSEHCPHCKQARPFVEALSVTLPWLKLHSLSVSGNRQNVIRYQQLAGALKQPANSVPAFLFCGFMTTGYADDQTTGNFLRENLELCHQATLDTVNGSADTALIPLESAPVSVPLLGDVDPASLSLPMLTMLLAGLDSFNPCAFFVLLFLLSLLVRVRSRLRMLLIGGVFVFFSGLMYFLFMAAWLNLFLVIGDLRWVTLAAGSVALIVGLFGVKDYMAFQQGISLSIPTTARQSLFKRMRTLLAVENLPGMLFATIVLAVAANSYELLCTAGFPMVFTRVLTLHELSSSQYYFYLVLYNIVYIIPLLAIVALFTLTMGARKLTQQEGRVLKLLSGLMMLELGLVLVFAPQALANLFTAIILVVIALFVTYILQRVTGKSAVGRRD